MKAGLLDTSVLVALEEGRLIDVEAIPPGSSISVITSAELRAGVLVASDTRTRTKRLTTLTRAIDLEPVPIDEVVATAWAELRAALLQEGRRLAVNDSWIAATAIAHGLQLITQDRDFLGTPGLDVVVV